MSDITTEERNVEESKEYKGKVYFNGFEVGFSNSDASIQLRNDSQTIVDLNLSFGTLKTMSEILTDLVKDIETRTGPILTISEFKEKMQESIEKEDIKEK